MTPFEVEKYLIENAKQITFLTETCTAQQEQITELYQHIEKLSNALTQAFDSITDIYEKL